MQSIKQIQKTSVFVPMAADIIHHGHINILLKAKKYGKVTVGLMTDRGLFSYKKRYPIISYKNRFKILEQIKCIDKIIPLNGLKYVQISKKYKFDYFVHGDDWKTGVQSRERKRLKVVMKRWNGKLIDLKYTPGISSSKIRHNLFKNEKLVYVGIAADILHEGHINILKVASNYGEVIVGLLTNRAIKTYKNPPILNYRQRKIVLENMKYVKKVIPQTSLDYRKNLLKIKPHFVVHGDDWKTGVQKKTRLNVIKLISKWSGKLIEPKYTKNISSSLIKKNVAKIVNNK